MVNWKTPEDQDYVGWLLDQKFSPYRDYLQDDIVVYDQNNKVRGHILLNPMMPAAAFASLGITLRAMSTHAKRYLWHLLRTNGFSRPESWILIQILGCNGDGYPLVFVPMDYTGVFYTGMTGGFLNLNNVFLKRPIMHINSSSWQPFAMHGMNRDLRAPIFDRKGYNPSNAIWDNDPNGAPNIHQQATRWFIDELNSIIEQVYGRAKATLRKELFTAKKPIHKPLLSDNENNLRALELIRGAMDEMRKIFDGPEIN
jgi:hypothetical protein